MLFGGQGFLGLPSVAAAATATMTATAAAAMEATTTAVEAAAAGNAGRAAVLEAETTAMAVAEPTVAMIKPAAIVSITFAIRPHVVTIAKASVTVATLVVVAVTYVKTHANAWPVARPHAAGCQSYSRKKEQAGRQPASSARHLVTAFVSLSPHSSSPTGAPCGSATTAIIPPCLSGCGCTNTRPPSCAAWATICAALSTRT